MKRETDTGRPAGLRLKWLAAIAAVVAVPKCLACFVGYGAFAAALGLKSPELCGGPAASGALPAALIHLESIGIAGLLGLGCAGVFVATVAARVRLLPATPRGRPAFRR